MIEAARVRKNLVVVFFVYLHWPVSKKVQVHVLSKKISLWMGGVKFLPPHKEVARKIIP